MKPSVKKVKDILGNYFEISCSSGKSIRFGYEISDDGDFLDKMHVILNEKAIDFIADNPSVLDWDRVFAVSERESKAYIESRLKRLGFDSIFFFLKKEMPNDSLHSISEHRKSIA